MSSPAGAAGHDLAGQVAIITGAGDEQGLGFAHARHLAARGARIVLNDLGGGTLGLPEQGIDSGTAERAAEALRAEGAEVLADNGDIADPATSERMVASALDAWGRLDIVVSNAGTASAQFFPDVDPDEVQRHVGVTLQGCLNTARAAWPHFVASGRGRIVLTGSPACFGNEIAAYSSTKAGLFGLTRTMAIFGQPHGVTANLILPVAVSRLTLLLPESPFKDALRDGFAASEVSPLVGHLVSPACTVNGEAFLVGGGGFARVVYAAGPVESLDGDAVAVGDAVNRAMVDSDWTPLGSTRKSTTYLGLPPDP